MSASVGEVQEHADAILLQLGQRIRSGQMVIHFHDGVVQRVECNSVHKPKAASLPCRRATDVPLDTNGT